MSKITTRPLTRRDFIMTNANILLSLGAGYYLSGCANHDDHSVGEPDDELLPPPPQNTVNPYIFYNPFTGVNLGSCYLLNKDRYTEAAFVPHVLASLSRVASLSESTSYITTTNRAVRTQDDFSMSVSASVKGKLFGGTASLSNTYNRSESKVHEAQTLCWISRTIETANLFNIDWGSCTFKQFLACLKPGPQSELADILDLYGQTIKLIEDGKTETVECIQVAKEYQTKVEKWYEKYGQGFVSGLWVGMIGQAKLTITSTMDNSMSAWSNNTSVAYSSPVAGANLAVALKGYRAEFTKVCRGNIEIKIAPANNQMENWRSRWEDQFLIKIDNYETMKDVNTKAPDFIGEAVEVELEPPTDGSELNKKVNENFKLNNKEEVAKKCVQVMDWAMNRVDDEGLNQYISNKEAKKIEIIDRYADLENSNQFDKAVEEIIENTSFKLNVPAASGEFSTSVVDMASTTNANEKSGWNTFVGKWTPLGCFVNRWADVIPQLSLATDTLSTEANLTDGLVYLWALRYQSKLLRLKNYIDFCYPYAIKFAWAKDKSLISSFSDSLGGYVEAFNKKIKDLLENAPPGYTTKQFYNALNDLKQKQEKGMFLRKMYDCWSVNYEFFKQADFGCGLVMLPSGFGTNDPQFLFAGTRNGDIRSERTGYVVDWLQTYFDSQALINDTALFANLPKLIPLIYVDGRIGILMIGSCNLPTDVEADLYGTLDVSMYKPRSGYYVDETAFTFGSLEMDSEESKAFWAKNVSPKVYEAFEKKRNTFYGSTFYGSKFYQDDFGPSALHFHMGLSPIGRCGGLCRQKTLPFSCGKQTAFYLIPLSASSFPEGTLLRGPAISHELPECIASPSIIYGKNEMQEFLADSPSSVYQDYGSSLPNSTDHYMDELLNRHRVWQGIVPEPTNF